MSKQTYKPKDEPVKEEKFFPIETAPLGLVAIIGYLADENGKPIESQPKKMYYRKTREFRGGKWVSKGFWSDAELRTTLPLVPQPKFWRHEDVLR